MYKIITPVVTIFDEKEKPDYEANKKVIDYLIAGGVDGILVLGSTGEFTGLTREEKQDFFQFYADYVKQRVELYAGTGSMNFEDTKILSNAVYDMGYEGPMVIAPFYYGLDQEKIFVFYDTLAKALQGKLYIYNFPARTGHSINPETLRRLLEANDNIAGLKDSVSEPGHTGQLCSAAEGFPFAVYSGFDDQYLYNISAGGNGCIAGLSNVVPEIWRDLVKASNENHFEEVMKMSHLIHKLMPLYQMDSNFSLLFKILMVHRGLDISPKAIFPFNQIREETCKNAKKLLDQVLKEYEDMK